MTVAALLAGCGGGGDSGGDGGSAPSPVGAAPGPQPAPTPGDLKAAPVVRFLRDDRVASPEMDYNADSPWGQFWRMSGSPDDDAGFLVSWWPEVATSAERASAALAAIESSVCLSPDSRSRIPTEGLATPVRARSAALDLPAGAKRLVTANRRVQLQPLDNDRAYRVRVQRLGARGKVSSQASEFSFNGGDSRHVAGRCAPASRYKHPHEIAADSILTGIFIYCVFGGTAEAGAWASLVGAFGACFYHSNLRAPTWVGWFRQRPEHHSIHHALGVHAFNFGDFTARCGFAGQREQRLGAMLRFEDVHRAPRRPRKQGLDMRPSP